MHILGILQRLRECHIFQSRLRVKEYCRHIVRNSAQVRGSVHKMDHVRWYGIGLCWIWVPHVQKLSVGIWGAKIWSFWRLDQRKSLTAYRTRAGQVSILHEILETICSYVVIL